MPFMRGHTSSFFYLAWPYGLAVLAVAFLTGLAWLFKDHLNVQVIALLFLLPVVLSARLGGMGPGILSATCAFLSLNYFFIPPLFTLVVHHTQDLLALIVFLVIAVVISQLLGRAQLGMAIAFSREHEATRLYELSTALAGLQDDEAIARTLAEKIHQAFAIERVEVTIKGPSSGGYLNFNYPAQPATLAKKPDITTPLMTARGEQGQVHLWRKGASLSPQEQRLLSTFANQGALAIERANLVQAENRTKILEESDRLKSSLLSSVSHELRSPLATIKASISSLRSGAVDWDSDARQDLLAAIEEESDHLNQLVGNLLDMSRIETGALRPQRGWNSMAEIVNGVLKRMRPTLQQHHIILDIPADFPLLPVDYVQMEQVFTNLLSNSVKYAPPGSNIQVCASLQNDQEALIQVSNQGPPVLEEHLERIFDKFYRVTAADKVTGTGLGLSICKGIIEAHGGRIWAENQPEAFVFKFTLLLTYEGARPHVPEEVSE
jgi:two-component system sensor histidine kinase KdpD